jgi:sugar phosphate isomerase/epimerase
VEELRAIMREHDLYAFTLNGFPYGAFHGQAVKTEVYRPDWTDPRRLQYTRELADVLAALLPEGVEGSISTVPLSYKAWPSDPAAQARLFDHLAAIVVHCRRLQLRTGHEIHIGLEPEPDCTLETTAETVAWFEGPLDREAVPRVASALACSRPAARAILRRHLGVCFDTCHLAVQYEGLADSLRTLAAHDIRISKVQLSAALEADAGAASRERLKAFCDPVYLHQVKVRTADSQTNAFADLPEALASVAAPGDRWRIHFHVPLYFEGDGALRSTASALDAPFWTALAALPVSHVEIETYTFHVLPADLQAGGVTQSIAREFAWVRQRLAPLY